MKWINVSFFKFLTKEERSVRIFWIKKFEFQRNGRKKRKKLKERVKEFFSKNNIIPSGVGRGSYFVLMFAPISVNRHYLYLRMEV